ncbi:tetratricopeptide repeat protein [Streptosporangium algeriense]|uniref:Tetratricopeptide repeat protein n=1 Tax=Streptosporangium algeriense TaxID=1682748 RepID=A0ABW3DTW8_9ACTN
MTPLSTIGWALADTWTITRRDLTHWALRPGTVAIGWVFPVMIALMFGGLFGGAIEVPGAGGYFDFLMPGMFTLTVFFGLENTMMAVTTDAAKGVTDRFRSMPMSSLAVVAGRQRRHQEALALFDSARKVFREMGAPGGEALTLSYSARDHLFLGQAEEAISAAEQGLTIFTEIGSSPGTARARYHLGMVLSRVGRLNEAVHHHAECLAFFRTSGQRVWEQRVCSRLAETFITAGRFGDATRHAEQALAVSVEIGHPYGEALSLWVLGRALVGQGDIPRSRDCLQRAHDIFDRLGAPEAADIRVLLDRDPVGN